MIPRWELPYDKNTFLLTVRKAICPHGKGSYDIYNAYGSWLDWSTDFNTPLTIWLSWRQPICFGVYLGSITIIVRVNRSINLKEPASIFSETLAWVISLCIYRVTNGWVMRLGISLINDVFVEMSRPYKAIQPELQRQQGKSEGFVSCDRPSNLTQIGFKSSIFQPMWPWNLMDDLEKL